MWIQGALLCSFFLFAGSQQAPRLHHDINGALFTPALGQMTLLLIVQVSLVLLPAILGMYQGIQASTSPLLQLLLWAAAIGTVSAIPKWLSLPSEAPWRIRLMLLAVYWPLGYVAVATIRRYWSRKTAASH